MQLQNIELATINPEVKENVQETLLNQLEIKLFELLENEADPDTITKEVKNTTANLILQKNKLKLLRKQYQLEKNQKLQGSVDSMVADFNSGEMPVRVYWLDQIVSQMANDEEPWQMSNIEANIKNLETKLDNGPQWGQTYERIKKTSLYAKLVLNLFPNDEAFKENVMNLLETYDLSTWENLVNNQN